MSVLQSLLMGSGLTRMVQAGHYSGYSSILIGMMLRKMDAEQGLISFDIDQAATRFAQTWIERADLTKYVRLVVADSSDPIAPGLATHYLGGQPQIIFIDSSHQYRHTMEELALWSRALELNGFICLHDVSLLAEGFDITKRGGVRRALLEWRYTNPVDGIMINGTTPVTPTSYLDACGLGIIQTRSQPSLLPSVIVHEEERRIIRDPTFELSDSWFGEGWTIGRGITRKAPGSIVPLACYAPIKGGETYAFRLNLADVRSGHIYIDAGVSGDPGNYLSSAGASSTYITAGETNGFVAVVPSSDFDGTILSVDAAVA